MESTDNHPPQEETRFVAGAAWMVAMRWAIRFIGLFSSVVLARLLVPEDFGLVAMAMVVVALVDTLATSGVDLALIREREHSRKLYDAAWTIQVLQGVFVALLLLGIIPFAVDYFDEARLVVILQLIAVSHFIQSFKNIGIVSFRKELKFAKEFRFSLYVKLVAFFATISMAFWLKDYRAIVYGMLVRSCASLVLSYVMHTYRPSFSTSEIKKIWSFSQWFLVSSIIRAVNAKIGQLIVGGSLGASSLGFYYLAVELGSMFISEVVLPINRALFPNLSTMLADEVLFAENGLKAIGFAGLLCLPIGLGIFLIAPDLVILLFGKKWLDAIPVLQWTVLLSVVTGVSLSMNLILTLKNKVHLTTIKAAVEVLILIPVIYFVAKKESIECIAMANFIVAMLVLPMMAWFVKIELKCSIMRLLSLFWRPFLSALAMYFVCHQVFSLVELPLIARMSLNIFTGVLIYITTLYALWRLSGSPNTAEKLFVDMCSKAWSRVSSA